MITRAVKAVLAALDKGSFAGWLLWASASAVVA